METIELIAAERRYLADLADKLDEDLLATPSLCGAWTVRDVLAHLLMPLVVPRHVAVLEIARSGFRFDRANVALTARLDGLSAAEIAEGLRTNAEHRYHPPGYGLAAPLTDLLVHTQDVCRPLDLYYAPTGQPLAVALRFLTSGRAYAFVRRGTRAGLRLEAPDAGFASGAGPLVRGPGIDLALALTGRASGLAGLEGDGVELLRSRIL